jgi:hypothetical protein
MRIVCEHCGKTVNVNDRRQISHATRQRSSAVPAAHLIMETGHGHFWLVHRCLVQDNLDVNRALPSGAA